MSYGRRPRSPAEEARSRQEMESLVDKMRACIADYVEAWGLKAGQAQGYLEHNEWVCLNPLRGTDSHPGSFRVPLSGPKQGMVIDHAGIGIVGKATAVSPLSFHAHVLFGGDMRAAVADAKRRHGLDGTNPAALKATREREAKFLDRQARHADEEAQRQEEKGAWGKARWLEALPDLAGTPVWAYLHGRGIDLGRLSHPVNALRYHPALKCSETGRFYPAMVAPFVNAKGNIVGAHRTWLEVLPDGQVVKARDVRENKKSIGPVAGSTIRLWNGEVIDPETGEIRYGPKLSACKGRVTWDLTEGIENGLSVVVELPELRVVAAGSLSYLRRLAKSLPPQVEALRIWKDADPPGSQPDRLFHASLDDFPPEIKLYLADVSKVSPGVKDVNALLQSQQGEG